MTEISTDTPWYEGLKRPVSELAFGVTELPGGHRGAYMAVGGEVWVQYETKNGPIAYGVRKQLKDEFGIETRSGVAIDVEESFATGNTTILDRGVDKPGVEGIYVRPEALEKVYDPGWIIRMHKAAERARASGTSFDPIAFGATLVQSTE